jgi:hypothetical protein
LQTELDLYRSVRVDSFPNGTVINEKPAPEVLYPDFVPRVLPSGKRRAADVKVEDGWVHAGGGTSLFDRPGVFTTRGWLSFDIPKGTVVPDSLVIQFTGRNEALQADHYQIESRTNKMRVEAYKGALDNLARNAVVRSIELANGRQSR